MDSKAKILLMNCLVFIFWVWFKLSIKYLRIIILGAYHCHNDIHRWTTFDHWRHSQISIEALQTWPLYWLFLFLIFFKSFYLCWFQRLFLTSYTNNVLFLLKKACSFCFRVHPAILWSEAWGYRLHLKLKTYRQRNQLSEFGI